MNWLIKNARTIKGISETIDLRINDGKIAEIGENLVNLGEEEFDATGLTLAPGFVDLHIHLREPGGEHKRLKQVRLLLQKAGLRL